MTPASASNTPPLAAPGRRWQWLQRTATVALFCLTALVITVPANLLPFGLLLLGSSVVGIDYLWRARQRARPVSWVLGLLLLALLLSAAASIWQFEDQLRDVENRSRFIVMPWLAVWVCALRPSLRALWWGAVVGLGAVLMLSLGQVTGGAERASGSTNAIVLADMAMMLMVVAVFCRPALAARWVVLSVLAGGAIIVLSGSRGVWLPLALMWVVMALVMRWGSWRTRWLTLFGVAAVSAVAVLAVPALREQLRLDELQQDVQRLERGDVNSSAGARIERWQVAWHTLQQRPWQGVGIGRFDDAMAQLPACRVADTAPERCFLGHAHNDVAEWAATQGVPGLLLLLAVYGVPLAMFIVLFRRSGRDQFRGPAATGVMLVVAYVLCGLTQSMFAHQITAGFYACMVGVLAAFALGEVQRRGGSTSG